MQAFGKQKPFTHSFICLTKPCRVTNHLRLPRTEGFPRMWDFQYCNWEKSLPTGTLDHPTYDNRNEEDKVFMRLACFSGRQEPLPTTPVLGLGFTHSPTRTPTAKHVIKKKDVKAGDQKKMLGGKAQIFISTNCPTT